MNSKRSLNRIKAHTQTSEEDVKYFTSTKIIALLMKRLFFLILINYASPFLFAQSFNVTFSGAAGSETLVTNSPQTTPLASATALSVSPLKVNVAGCPVAPAFSLTGTSNTPVSTPTNFAGVWSIDYPIDLFAGINNTNRIKLKVTCGVASVLYDDIFSTTLTGPAAATAQSLQTDKFGLYSWKEAVIMQPSNLNGTPSAQTITAIPSEPGQKFRVVSIIGDKAIIKILDYTERKERNFLKNSGSRKYQPLSKFFKYNFSGSQADYNALSDEKASSRDYGNFQMYFSVPVPYIVDEKLTVRENRIESSLAAGVINYPFKYRPQESKGDFSGAFNFGAGIGYRFGHKSHRSFNWALISGYSISNIVLDSSNSSKNQGKLSSSNNFTAFSFSLGVLAQYQIVQVGIFLGWDRISRINQREFEWQYQGKPWISVGFGIAVFSEQKEKSKTSNEQ